MIKSQRTLSGVPWVAVFVISVSCLIAIDVGVGRGKIKLFNSFRKFNERTRLRAGGTQNHKGSFRLLKNSRSVDAVENKFEEVRNDDPAGFHLTKSQDHEAGTRRAEEYHYHDYAVFVVHYHKTGFVLSRELKKLVFELEREAKSPEQTLAKYKSSSHFLSGVDEELNERVAFDQYGNWARSAFPTRSYNPRTNCPKKMKLQEGQFYVQESPDLYCRDDDLAQRSGINSQKGGTKIIHFVRNPFDMVMSNYFYHSQDPTPEDWVHDHDPCDHFYKDGQSISAHIVPTLASEVHGVAATNITQEHFDNVLNICQSLYQSKRKTKKSSFYEHLRKLETWDGLQLAAAQMILSTGSLAGGDVMRMANNIVKFEHLVHSANARSNGDSPKIQLLTVSMDDFIKDPEENTLKFLNFVFGEEEDGAMTKEMKETAARHQQEKYSKKKKKSKAHLTQTNSDQRDVLRNMLRASPELGPILSQTEILVNEALAKSNAMI